MTVQELRQCAAERLQQAGIESYDYDAMALLEWVLGIDRGDYYADLGREISAGQLEKYMTYLDRRANREPLQYIMGSCAFMGYEFKVDPRVLIPRQDTEILVETALSVASRYQCPAILDLCCGSGCIGISLKKELPAASVTLADISEGALAVAGENAQKLQAEVTFIQSDLFQCVENQYSVKNSETGYDMIVSNPPYIRSAVIRELMTEVKDHEPMLALDGCEDGLFFYRKIVREAKDFLRPGGALLFEIGHDQGEALSALLKEADYEEIKVVKDLAGLDRVVYARK